MSDGRTTMIRCNERVPWPSTATQKVVLVHETPLMDGVPSMSSGSSSCPVVEHAFPARSLTATQNVVLVQETESIGRPVRSRSGLSMSRRSRYRRPRCVDLRHRTVSSCRTPMSNREYPTQPGPARSTKSRSRSLPHPHCRRQRRTWRSGTTPESPPRLDHVGGRPRRAVVHVSGAPSVDRHAEQTSSHTTPLPLRSNRPHSSGPTSPSGLAAATPGVTAARTIAVEATKTVTRVIRTTAPKFRGRTKSGRRTPPCKLHLASPPHLRPARQTADGSYIRS